jgi:predicted RNA binding protein YcfA (HicA-like mRNA interferase family)
MPKITPIHWKDLEKIFLAAGFQFARQEGSHRSYTKPGISRPIVIPTYNEIPVSIIRNNLKTAGLSREEYFRLLEKK